MNTHIRHEADQSPPLESACRVCQLSPVRGQESVDQAANRACVRNCETRSLAAGRTLVREGEPLHQLYVLCAGWAFYYKQLPDGRRQIAAFLLPGDTLMLEAAYFPSFPAPFSVKALSSIVVCGFAAADAMRLLLGSEARQQELYRARYQLMQSLHSRLFDLGRRTARGRLAQLVLELHERLGSRGMVHDDGSFDFPVRQEHLADALGLTAVYINRTLAQLRREGLMTIENGCLTVFDAPALRQVAQEE